MFLFNTTIAAITIAMVFAAPGLGDSRSTWEWKHPLPQGNHLFDISYTGGLFVAVGESRTILTSADATVWTTGSFGTANTLQSIAYGNSRWVVVGDSGMILASSDGREWKSISSGMSTDINDVVYGNGLFAAVGDTCSIITSNDGTTWKPCGSDSSFLLYSITYGNGIYMAVGFKRDYGGVVMTSNDGDRWTLQQPVGRYPLFNVQPIDNKFIAMDGDKNIFVSVDGATWTTTLSGAPERLTSIVRVDTHYVALGWYGTVMSSSDFSTWKRHFTDRLNDFSASTSGNGNIVAVGSCGLIAVSPDAINWNHRSVNSETDSICAVAYGNNRYIAQGIDRLFLTSTDGAEWTKVDSGISYANDVRSIIFSKSPSDSTTGIFVAVGDGIGSSRDGLTWETHRIKGYTFPDLYSVACSPDLFVAVGTNGTIITSTDGKDWTIQTSGTTKNLRAVIYGNDATSRHFVATGDEGTILTSSNGVTWTARNEGSGMYLFAISFGNGKYIAGGHGDTILTSTDGTTWTKHSSRLSEYILSIDYGDDRGNGTPGKFIAVGTHGTIAQSVDGILWEPMVSCTPRTLSCVSYLNNRFFAAGDDGTILSLREDLTATAGSPHHKKTRTLRVAGIRVNKKFITATLPLSLNPGPGTARLFTINGSHSRSFTITVHDNIFSLPASHLGTGTYLLEITDSKGSRCTSRLSIVR